MAHYGASLVCVPCPDTEVSFEVALVCVLHLYACERHPAEKGRLPLTKHPKSVCSHLVRLNAW